jgi:general secretion pathway protein A
LTPLGREEVEHYVAHRFAGASRLKAGLSADALDLVHGFTEGIPRMVNNICDISLVIGYGRKLDSVDADGCAVWFRRRRARECKSLTWHSE